MPHRPRTSRTGFRRALAASAALHVLVAAVVVIVVRSQPEPGPGQPEIDPRIHDVVVRMTMPEELPVAVPPQEDPPATQPEPPPPSRPEPAGPPLAAATPNPLPAELVALIRRPTAASRQPVTDPNVTPAAGTTARPIHGALKAGQTVVYVLDCSGSMGEFGKFAAARAALAATLRRQPESVRFQVIVYAGTVTVLLPGGCVPATAENIAEAEARLAEQRPSGPSNHAEAVRRAAALRPDVILVLTDADDLSANKLKPVSAGGGKPVPLFVALVAEGVANPRELR